MDIASQLSPATSEAAAAISLQIIAQLTEGYPRNFTVRLWDGATWQPGQGESSFTLVLNHPGTVRTMIDAFNGSLAFCEAYIFDDYDVEGDVLGFADWIRHLVETSDRFSLWQKLSLLRSLLKLPKVAQARDTLLAGKPTQGDHALDRDREAISYTYDLPAEFYELFLDKNMQYTCGYFSRRDEDQDIAQERKMDYICRKLRLKAGERYVDFGCGWGGLLIHAAKNYGVEAVGVTLSKSQAEWARRLIAEAGLQDRVRIELTDYRHFKGAGSFDKASSVGMGEHIGSKNLPVFLGKIFESLKPEGAYLHHTITRRPGAKAPRWTAFSHKYVFPNGDMQAITYILETAAALGFEIRDVESIREHYVPTLEAWVRKLESNREKVVAMMGEVRYRIFRLYMAGATVGFHTGVYNLHQSLLVKTHQGRSGLPLMRSDWYR